MANIIEPAAADLSRNPPALRLKGRHAMKPDLLATAPDPETALRELWTAEGVSTQRQDELIAQITAKAQPGAKVGPFTIGQPTTEADRQTYQTQLTKAGEQYMIPGTEPEDRPKSAQLSLF